MWQGSFHLICVEIGVDSWQIFYPLSFIMQLSNKNTFDTLTEFWNLHDKF